MKTIFPLTFKIDDESFDIEVHEISKKNTKTLDYEYEKATKVYQEYDLLKAEIQSLEDEKELLTETLKYLSGDDKIKALQDSLSLVKKIRTKNNILVKKGKESSDVDIVNEKMFDLAIKGKDVKSLKSAIDKKGLTYKAVTDAIGEATKKEREKK